MTLSRREMLAGGVAIGGVMPSIARAETGLAARRADFPIVADGRAFLNSAYIAPIPRQVAQAAADFMLAKATRPIEVRELLATTERVRRGFAKLINADADEVGLLFSTAEGENVVAQGLDLKPGDNVVIDDLHYDTEFILYRELERSRGIELRIAKNRGGQIEARDFEPLVNRRTRLISVAAISHRNGFRHDLRPLADLAHAHGAYLYTDAIQAVGSVVVDVRASDVDFLCAGSYKWMLAGWGVAPFYCHRSLAERLKLDRVGEMHADALPDGRFAIDRTARRFDYSSRAFGEAHTLAAALDYLDGIGVAAIETHGVVLGQRLFDAASMLGLRMLTPPGNRAPVVAFETPGVEADVRAAFAKARIDVTVRQGRVRIAPALFNTTDDIDRAVEVLRGLRK